ncbi:MAG: hypothetical protein II625_07975 [Bacilli bacterium]|nr:hypothetical protein [Bacilli bacterium]
MSLLLALCDKSYMMQVILIVKTFFKFACYLAPIIVIIISIIHIFKVVMNGKEDDLKEAFKVTVKRIIAGLLIAFIPGIINYVFTGIVDASEVEFLSCFETASKEKVEALKQKEEAEAAAKEKQQEKEDEEQLRKAYEEEQKIREGNKESFEEWKKRKEAEERNNNNSNNNGSNLRGNAWVQNLLSEAKSITDYARNNGFTYGNAPINPAINHDAKIVSCDRCVGWFLYNVGYTDQPYQGGIVVRDFPAWCEQHGFKRINNMSELQAGDIVFTNPEPNGNPAHTFLLGNPVGDGVWERYDCGKQERISLTGQYSGYTSQPFKEPIANFMFAYRAPEAE